MVIVGLAALQSFGIDAGRAMRYSREGTLWQGWSRGDSLETVGDSLTARDSLAGRDSIKETTPPPSPDEIEKRLREQIDSLRAVRNGISAEINELNNELYSLDSLAGADSITARIDSLAGIRDSLANIESVYSANDTVYLRDSYGFVRDTVLVPSRLKKNDPFKYKYYTALRDSSTRAQLRDSLIGARDSIELYLLDSLYIKDSTDIENSKPPIMARDTIVVPDSLKYT
ncbi:MAG: hypothetical protein LUD72_14135, partial [Bacteroidales bacterium]|nr:hypothetical protein [Bacteroidales bacterium]